MSMALIPYSAVNAVFVGCEEPGSPVGLTDGACELSQSSLSSISDQEAQEPEIEEEELEEIIGHGFKCCCPNCHRANTCYALQDYFAVVGKPGVVSCMHEHPVDKLPEYNPFPCGCPKCRPRAFMFGPYALCYTQRMWTVNTGDEWVPFVHEYEHVMIDGQRFYWSGEYLITDGPLGHVVFDADWVYLPKWKTGFGTPWCGFEKPKPTYSKTSNALYRWGAFTPSMRMFPDTTLLCNTRPFPRWF